MTSQLVISTILISLALVFYSIGVWSERLAGRLKGWHLVFVWAVWLIPYFTGFFTSTG